MPYITGVESEVDMKSFLLCCLLAAIPVAAFAANAADQETLLCHGEGGSTILVELWKPSEFDGPVHCVRTDGMNAITACAPQGGWGLSSGAAGTDLIEITNDWKTAHKHQAGKLTAVAGVRGIRFNAQHGVGVGSNLSYEWKFSIDRGTGEATWFASDGTKTRFTCEKPR